MNGHELSALIDDLQPAGRIVVETNDGEHISGLFDGVFSIDSEPERGLTGIQVAYQDSPGTMPKVRYVPVEDVADVYLDNERTT